MKTIICALLVVSCAVPFILCFGWIDRNVKRCGAVELFGMSLFTCAWWIVAAALIKSLCSKSVAV